MRSRAMSSVQGSVTPTALEHQPALTGTVCERLHTPVVLIAATVKHRAVYARRLGSLGEQQPCLLGLLGGLKVAQRQTRSS